MSTIYREQTELEKNLKKGGFIDLRSIRENDWFTFGRKRIAEEQAKAQLKGVPYASKKAMRDLTKRNEEILKSIELARDKGDREVKVDLDIDFSSYVGWEHFTKVNDVDIYEETNINGIKRHVKTGEYKELVCKETGQRVSFEVPNEKLENEQKTATEKKKD
jgi:hypothetical protein